MVACWTIPEKSSLLQIFFTITIEFQVMLLDYKDNKDIYSTL